MPNVLNEFVPNSISSTLPNSTSISDILGLVLNLVMGIGFSIALISVAYSGITYVLSSGDPKNTSKAWAGFLYGGIAALVTLGAFVIKNAIIKLTGADGAQILNAVPTF